MNTEFTTPMLQWTEQELFRSVRISDFNNANSAVDTLHLLSKDQMQGRLLDELWKAHFIDANVSRSIELLTANEDPGLIRLLYKKTKGVTRAEVRASLKRAKIRIDFPMPALVGGAVAVSKVAGTLAAGAADSKVRRSREQNASLVGIAELIQAGLIRTPLRIEREYKGAHLTAVVKPDGKIEFDGEVYDSLSTAAGMARKSAVGAPSGHAFPQTNGWTFWMCASPDGVPCELDRLRQDYPVQRKLKVVPMA